jgi:hypothetical protein
VPLRAELVRASTSGCEEVSKHTFKTYRDTGALVESTGWCSETSGAIFLHAKVFVADSALVRFLEFFLLFFAATAFLVLQLFGIPALLAERDF